jgi:hypothetical protein
VVGASFNALRRISAVVADGTGEGETPKTRFSPLILVPH